MPDTARDNTTVCELLRLGDAWTYEPYERFDVQMPDGSSKKLRQDIPLKLHLG